MVSRAEGVSRTAWLVLSKNRWPACHSGRSTCRKSKLSALVSAMPYDLAR